jgi:hypothetical protein
MCFLVGGQPDVLVNKIGPNSLPESAGAGCVTVGGGDVERLTEEGLIGLSTGDQGTVMNSRFPGKEERKVEDFAILGALFETPAMVSIECKMASNEFTLHLEGDLAMECDPRRKKAVLDLSSLRVKAVEDISGSSKFGLGKLCKFTSG